VMTSGVSSTSSGMQKRLGWAPFSFSKRIANRYLLSKRSEAFVTIITVIAVLGVCIGVAVLTIAMAIMTGFEHELRQKIVGSTHVVVYKVGGDVQDAREVEDLIAKTDGVASVNPFVEQQVMLTVDGRARGVLVRGIRSDSSIGKELDGFIEQEGGIALLKDAGAAEGSSESAPAAESNAEGNGEEFSGAVGSSLPRLVVGRGLADVMGLYPGQVLSLLLPKVGSTPFGLVPRYKRFQVAATYKSGLSGYEERLAYMDIGEAQQYFRLGKAVSGFEIAVDDPGQSAAVAKRLRDSFSRSPSHLSLIAQDWTQTNKELWEALAMEKQVYFIVLLLLIVMASFSIITTLIMIVIEKRKDIAILMTLGATARSIARIFYWQGIVIGALGVSSGVVLGVLGCIALEHYGFPLPEKVFPTSVVPVRLEAVNVVIVAISAFFICQFSAWYPSWRASRVEPAEALRY
jgi:lipoprotein-releasing system permease protein